VVCGIGMNVYNTSDELDDEAYLLDPLTSIIGYLGESAPDQDIDIAYLASVIVEELYSILREDTHDLLKYYRKHSLLINRKIEFFYQGEKRFGTVEDIDDDGALVVTSRKITLRLTSGEITLLDF
jgi:biotin-(acetyl-CoA carboxylase) ligase